jgi:uncharacterized protein
MKTSQTNHVIQPRKFANKAGEIRFNWLVKDFSELTKLLINESGEVKVLVNGYYDHNKNCLVKAEITATVNLECQTSFEPIEYKIDNTVTYCTVIDEKQIAEVNEQYEAILLEDGLLDLKKLIQDELILSLPIAANKPSEELDQVMSFGELDEEAIAKEKALDNPFTVLKGLKK